ncbi:hypothetical protein Tco_0327460 [Tanacetum coccineum]
MFTRMAYRGYFQIPIDPKDQKRHPLLAIRNFSPHRRMHFWGYAMAWLVFQRMYDGQSSTISLKNDWKYLWMTFRSLGTLSIRVYPHVEKMSELVCEDLPICSNIGKKSHFMVEGRHCSDLNLRQWDLPFERNVRCSDLPIGAVPRAKKKTSIFNLYTASKTIDRVNMTILPSSILFAKKDAKGKTHAVDTIAPRI